MKHPTVTCTRPRRAKLPAAAEYAGTCTKTLRRRIADGSLPGYRLGSRVIMVDLDDVDALFQQIPTVGAML
ncbi:helix-turn-helix domain-containing protein [Nocardioides sp.]|uniref:helix-turn-helix transcriptional regulator n=1 Tax=Nocardioides sp. TaxID=35761 RepID=UPI002605295B|nr:helix-turn-helix domain-containing protein [Nocardioides sp.]MDI6910483.1 helix-turn-helix domain-containing protein [Nocardioides sp.]